MATMPASKPASTQCFSVSSSVTSSYSASTGAAGCSSSPAPPSRARIEAKPCSSRNGLRRAGSRPGTAKASRSSVTGASSRSSTSSRETRACSANSMRLLRRLGWRISSARESSVSRSPYSSINCAAVLTPMPGTPGTLSLESPASACTSTTFSGGTPKRSTTSGPPILRCFTGSKSDIRSSTSCIRSLSEETMVTSAPSAAARRA